MILRQQLPSRLSAERNTVTMVVIALCSAAVCAAQGTVTYTWNALDMLTSATTPEETSSFTYDGDGQRISRSSAGDSVIYIRDLAGNVMAEYDSNGNLIAEYVYLEGSRIAKVAGDGSRRYYHTDVVGTPLVKTDENGNLVWEGENLPFGTEVASNDTEEDDTTKFTGKELDGETGLHYFGARYYDSRVGRFISIDPVSGSQQNTATWNRYVYSQNNPIRYVDPDGREIREKVHQVALGWYGTTAYHTSTVVIPDDQARFKNDSRFLTDADTGQIYVTFGAGPSGGELVSDTNRHADANLANEVESFVINLGGRDENLVIEQLFQLEKNYSRNTELQSIDYDFFPAAAGARRNFFIADDGYNSNSWNRGFLEAAGFTVPRPTRRVPGFDKPVPPSYFAKTPPPTQQKKP